MACSICGQPGHTRTTCDRRQAENFASTGLVVLALLGGLVAAVVALVEARPGLSLAGLAIALLLLLFWLRHRATLKAAEAERQRAEAEAEAEEEAARQARREGKLVDRFGADVAARVLRGEVWQGQTAEMLREALGEPAALDERVMKKKTRHVYKYGPQGGKRYALRVTLDDGVVVGWEGRE
jgi:hypothetical protein